MSKHVIFSSSLSYMESILFDRFDAPHLKKYSDDPEKNAVMQAAAEDIRNGALYEAIEDWRTCEKKNLQDDNYYYLVVVTCQTWQGKHTAYKLLEDLADLFSLDAEIMGDTALSIYLKGNSLQGKIIHHDGTHYFKVYRILQNASAVVNGCDRFLWDAQAGEYLSNARIKRYCRSAAPFVRAVYGL